MEFFTTLLTELGKGFMGEAGKAGARALFSREAPTPEPEHALEDELEPQDETQEALEGFFDCLAVGDPDAAWTWCDPEWPHDPQRSQSYHDTFSLAPPISWSVRQQYVPSDWSPGEWLEWVAWDVVVTFDNGDGSFSAHPAAVVALPLDDGWRIAEVVWDPGSDEAPEPVTEEEVWLVVCERCPAELAIPVGLGPFSIRCPDCWTPQTIDRDALFFESFGEPEVASEPLTEMRVVRCERCPQMLSIPIGVGRIRLKCPSCWTPQEIDT
jgi:hypothetical protein